MNEYLEKLLLQIRCKKVHPYIVDEIRGHIEDQIEDNMALGMDREEAEKQAVLDMGDPVEAGVALDRIHKPQVSWNLIGIVCVLSLLSVIIQYSILKTGTDSSMISHNFRVSRNMLSNVLLGLGIMCFLYVLDYTLIAKYAKFIGGAMLFLGVISVWFGMPIQGRNYYVSVGSFTTGFALTAFMMLYVPIYGAILYQYRGGGRKDLVKAILLLVLPCVIVYSLPSIINAWMLLICLSVVLSIALAKGWFRVRKRLTIVAIWSTFFVLPIMTLFGMYSFHLLKAYQEERMKAYLSPSYAGDYIGNTIRGIAENASLFGKSVTNIAETVPEFNMDLVFTYILGTYGSMAGIIVAALLGIMIVCIFAAAFRQKNELGFVMGCGCGMVLLINTVMNLLCAVGLIPFASSFLPFFSAGGSNLILSYALVGIVLSIYKYKDVYPRHVKKEMRKLTL